MATIWDGGDTFWDGGDTSWDSSTYPCFIPCAIPGSGCQLLGLNTYPCFFPCEIPGPGCQDLSRGGCYILKNRFWVNEYDSYPCQEINC